MKIDRVSVYNRYNGHCAYCGKPITLSTMQIDHIISKSHHRFIPKHKKFQINNVENLNPACRCCNIRKGPLSVDEFRKQIKRDILQLRRDNAKFRTVERFGLIKVSNINVVFYFEKVRK